MLTIIKNIAASIARAVARILDPAIPVTPHTRSVAPRSLVPGHTIMGNGAAYTPSGTRLNYNSTGGWGSALCSCGATSPTYPTRDQRRSWHRQHKAAIL